MTGETQIPAAPRDEWAFEPAQPLPPAVDVVIVGGGIVGVSAAWFLARRGVAVLVLEKGRIAGEQSGRNWGWVRQQGRSPVELPLMMRSLAIWKSLGVEAGDNAGFTQGGCLYLAEDEAQLAAHAAFLPIAQEHGLDTVLLGRAALNSVLAGGSARWHGALYTASDGRAEPNRAAPVIARAAVRAGARVISGCVVNRVETQAGRVSAVVTAQGRIATSTVVCAAGAWTSLFSRTLGVNVPQLRVKGSVARTAPTVEITSGTAFGPRVAIRRRCDGGYTVAHGAALEHVLGRDTWRYALKFRRAFLQEHGAVRLRLTGDALDDVPQGSTWPSQPAPVLAPSPSRAILEEVRGHLQRDFPEIAGAELVESWAGVIEASPDVLPLISAVDRLPGYFIATGFSGHGFGIGPAAGELVADLVLGTAAPDTAARFRLQRFYDGTPITPGPSV
jgi:glycine/D-amino acid oxidase-like deaminating enzyme